MEKPAVQHPAAEDQAPPLRGSVGPSGSSRSSEGRRTSSPAPTPKFYITGRRSIRPEALLLAVVIAVSGVSLIAYGLGKTRQRQFATGDSQVNRSSDGSPSAHEKDDPSQVDTIVLGDPADAPVPARKGEHASSDEVHPTIIVRLPRFGEQFGLIPDTPAGHLLYRWLAAFNQTSPPLLASTLPNNASGSTSAAQVELRQQTGGFNLLSAREVQPGVLVFRLRDQTPEGKEVLGTLHVRPGSNPAAIASFSLRAIPPTAPILPRRP